MVNLTDRAVSGVDIGFHVGMNLWSLPNSFYGIHVQKC